MWFVTHSRSAFPVLSLSTSLPPGRSTRNTLSKKSCGVG